MPSQTSGPLQQDYLPLELPPGASSSKPPGEWDADDVASWLDSLGVRFRTSFIGRKTGSRGWLHDEWYCVFHSPGYGKVLIVPSYSKGIGHAGKRPTAHEVLTSLKLDFSYMEDREEFFSLFNDEEEAEKALADLSYRKRQYDLFWSSVDATRPEAHVFDVLEELEA